MIVLWSCNEVRADNFQKNWKSSPSEGQGDTMQHVVVALGIKKEGRVEYIGASAGWNLSASRSAFFSLSLTVLFDPRVFQGSS